MSLNRTRLAALVPLVVAATVLSSLSRAQVPPGHAVVGTCSIGGAYPGTPGLFLFPLDGGPTTQGTPITGLPPALSTAVSAGHQGVSAVSLRSSDGAILVTTLSNSLAPTQGVTELYILHLNGTTVSQTQAILLGTATTTNPGQNTAAMHAQLPDGRILVSSRGTGQGTSPVSGGPMAGHFNAIVDPSSPNPVTVLPNAASIPSNQIRSGGVVVDPSGDFFYMLQSRTYHGTPGWTLIRQDLTPPYADCVIASSATESAHGMVGDDDGTLYITSGSASGWHTHRLTPDGCNVLALNPVTANNVGGSWGLDLDRASGMLVGGTIFPYPQMGDLGRIDPTTGVRTVIGTAPPGGWGMLGYQGVAVHNAIQSYGPRSDATNRHWFDNFPNPGGQPQIGNAGFSLTMSSTPGTALASAILLSFGRGSFSVLGAEILVDPNTGATLFVGSGLSVPYPLPVPANPGLAGLTIRAQSLHLETGNALAASRGLEFTLQ